MTREELGRANFQAYNKSTGGLTHDGKPIPSWEALSEKVREAWRAGAEEVAKVHQLSTTPKQ